MARFGERLSREVFIPSPGPGIAAHAASYDLDGAGRLLSIHGLMSRSDTVDAGFLRWSADNGATWSAATEWPTRYDAPGGTGRRHHRGVYRDPASGRLIALWTQGVLPQDDPIEGQWHWVLYHAISTDGGRSFGEPRQIIHAGAGYDSIHHLPGITVGKNCAMMGDLGERPLTRADGAILIPVQISRTGPDGEYLNPGPSFTFLDSLMLVGRWQKDGSLSWTCSEPLLADPAVSTRGFFEPTLAALADGRLLCVMRGSNTKAPKLPGWRWYSLSADGGQTWSPVAPWHFTDGGSFHSPSSCSQLIPWPDGRIFWMGNICGENPDGNGPRYPMVIAQVDPDSGFLRRDSLATLDDRAPGESARLTLSNFYARRDPLSGQLLLHLTRLFPKDGAGGKLDWTADALLDRYAIPD